MGKGNFEAQSMLHAHYGKKVTIALCGPVGEYQGLLAGIAFSDKDGRPARLAARGGVGAVMGSKKVKAIVVDLDKIPPFHEPKKVNASIKDYAKMLQADGIVQNFYAKIGTMGMADVQNQMGGLPVRNFSAGRQADLAAGEKFKMGGDYIGQLNTSRGGEQTHACMPGCVIQCSNVYHDAAGKEVVSPVEYETLGLLGTNCGISDPDDLAQLNHVANDLGVDTIELGGMLAVLMEAGLGAFGDVKFMTDCLVEIRKGTEQGRIWAQGTARVGEHYKVRRVPVIKKQAISAYDPRVVEATGITMMATAQGADHTAGNLPRLKTREMDLESLLEPEPRPSGPGGRQRLARALHLRHERHQPEHRVADQCHQLGPRHRAHPGLLRGAWPRRPPAGEGVQPPGRLHGEGRRAARASSTRRPCLPPITWRASTPRMCIRCTSACPPRAGHGHGHVGGGGAGRPHPRAVLLHGEPVVDPARGVPALPQHGSGSAGDQVAGLQPGLLQSVPRRRAPSAALALVATGRGGAGMILIAWSCACMLAAAVVLAASSPQMMRGAAIQGLPPSCFSPRPPTCTSATKPPPSRFRAKARSATRSHSRPGSPSARAQGLSSPPSRRRTPAWP